MIFFSDISKLKNIARYIILMTGAGMLSACSASQISSLLPSSPFSKPAETVATHPQIPQSAPTVTAGTSAIPNSVPNPRMPNTPNIIKASPNQTVSTPDIRTASRNGTPVQTAGQFTCPKFKIWRAGKFVTFYANSNMGDPASIIHQAEIKKIARECHPGINSITAKLGIAGRVLLGPKGKASNIRLPILIHVTGPGGKKLKTTKYITLVSVPAGSSSSQFSIVENFSFETTPGVPSKSYRIYVEFDKSAASAS